MIEDNANQPPHQENHMSRPSTLLLANALLFTISYGSILCAADAPAAPTPGATKEANKKETPKQKEWTGTVTKTATSIPILISGNVRYRLKAAEGAPASVTSAIEAITKGTAEGKTFLAKGTESNDDKGKSWISASELSEVVSAPTPTPKKHEKHEKH